MFEDLNKLNPQEKEVLTDALPLIAVYVAGADGDIDAEELSMANKITHIRSYKMKGSWQGFYKQAFETMDEKIRYYIETLPESIEERNQVIGGKLSKINDILSKLEVQTAAKLYSGYLSFAGHIAKASGGILGFHSISSAEAKAIKLSMLIPIVHDEEE